MQRACGMINVIKCLIQAGFLDTLSISGEHLELLRGSRLMPNFSLMSSVFQSLLESCRKDCNVQMSGFVKRNTGWAAIRRLPLIRSFQTIVTSDQTIPDKIIFWSDQSALEIPCALEVRSLLSLIRPCKTEMTSDQTEIRPLSNRLRDHGPDHTQTIVQTIVRSKSLLIRLLCALNDLWSDSIAPEIVWSENGFHYERISLILLQYIHFIKVVVCSIKFI